MTICHTTTTRFAIDSDAKLLIFGAATPITLTILEAEDLHALLPDMIGLARKLQAPRAASPLTLRAAVSVAPELPQLGAPYGGGFCAGPHPTIAGTTLIVGSRSMEASELTWEQAVAHCEGFGDGWRAPTRVEAITIADRLAPDITEAAAFQEGGAEAFARDCYWTDEASQFVSSFAWGQDFGNGFSDVWFKDYGLRVRPVRIV